MSLPSAQPLHLPYAVLSATAEKIAVASRVREIDDFSALLRGMGGRLETQSPESLLEAQRPSLEVFGPKDFVARVPEASDLFLKTHLASALCHYLLHAREGRSPAAFYSRPSELYNLEALWFALTLLIPDRVFILAQSAASSNDEALASLFRIPLPVLGLKRKIMSAQGLLPPAECPQQMNGAAAN